MEMLKVLVVRVMVVLHALEVTIVKAQDLILHQACVMLASIALQGRLLVIHPLIFALKVITVQCRAPNQLAVLLVHFKIKLANQNVWCALVDTSVEVQL